MTKFPTINLIKLRKTVLAKIAIAALHAQFKKSTGNSIAIFLYSMRVIVFHSFIRIIGY
jgi:hypothetical protein